MKEFDGRCEFHGLFAAGSELGFRVRGSRKVGVFVADRDGRFLVADTPSGLLGQMKADAEGVADRRQVRITPPPRLGAEVADR